jgi:hypothetical protein
MDDAHAHSDRFAVGRCGRNLENTMLVKATDGSKSTVAHCRKKDAHRKIGLVRKRVRTLRSSPENDLYRPIDIDNPDADLVALANSVKRMGVLEPPTVTLDNFVVSGHRRIAAARIAGVQTVRCRVLPKARADYSKDEYVALIRENNHQRVKTIAEMLREEVVSAEPEVAHRRLIQYRAQECRPLSNAIPIRGRMNRRTISDNHLPFVVATKELLKLYEAFLPLSLRQLHYYHLNDPPLKHAFKPTSRYTNDRKSYNFLSDITTRARIECYIPYDAIADETRPTTQWEAFPNPQSFIRKSLDGIFADYCLDLQADQPYHVELAVEKLTVKSILHSVAAEFTVPMTMGRGYGSITCRRDMMNRFYASGKSKMVIVVVSDCDPDGEDLGDLWGRSLRDDMDVTPELVRPALTWEQAHELNLPKGNFAKESSSRTKGYVQRHGTDDVWELEAIPPATLQGLVRDGLQKVMDIDRLNAALQREKQDAVFLDSCRQRAMAALRDVVQEGATE